MEFKYYQFLDLKIGQRSLEAGAACLNLRTGDQECLRAQREPRGVIIIAV